MKIEVIKIKGMVCSRCIKVLRSDLEAVGAVITEIKLGSVIISYDSKKINIDIIKSIIEGDEFEIITDKYISLAEETKHLILEFTTQEDKSINLSDFLTEKLAINYSKISKNFSRVFGFTIEQYCISVKIEKVKEMIELGGLTFSEIAFILGYQNLGTLSKLFKHETGISMSAYSTQKIVGRIPLDKLSS
jgi:AraC family transcriptional regulator